MYKPLFTNTIKPNKFKTFIINQFFGVDYTSGEFITNYRRSPDASNVIWGVNPYHIETRNGTKRILSSKIMDGDNEAVIYGIHTQGDIIVVHAADKLYLLSGDMDAFEYEEIYSGVEKQYSSSFVMNGKMYILAGKYIEIENSTASEPTGFIPTTVINRPPNGGGTPFEAVNLLSKSRINSFYAEEKTTEIEDTFTGDNTETVFTLTESKITSDDFTVTINDIEQLVNEDYTIDRIDKKITFETPPPTDADISVAYMAYLGDWIDTYVLDSEDIDYTELTVTVDGVVKTEGDDYTVNRETGVVTFLTAPQSEIGGIDNVIIQFDKSVGNTVEIEQIEEGDGETVTFDLNTDYPITDATVTVEIESVVEEDFTVDRVAKTITFDVAPANEYEIVITYSVIQDTRRQAIDKCTIYGIFGGKNDTRVFLTGNEDYPNRDWQSGLYDATYFPDTGYTDIGGDNYKIMGYVKQYDTQMIIKEGNQQDGSAFLRTFELDNENKPLFPVEQGAVGIGAVSSRCFGYVQGEPLFLSSQGVVGVQGTNVDYQRLIQDKSGNINSVIIGEDLSKAFAVEYKNKYYLFVNGNVYVCDARMRYTDALGNVQYEWLHWEGLNATCATVYNDYLLYGYAGQIFRFKLNHEVERYTDEDYNGSKTNIASHWVTPSLFFNTITNKKILNKVYIMFLPKTKANVKVECTADNERTVDLGEFERTVAFNFTDDIDFNETISFTDENTAAEKINVNLNGFDDIKFKISSETGNIGLEMIQAIYREV